MPFCPICGRHHDPDIGCSDATGQAIREMGLRRVQPGGSTSNAGRHYRLAVWVLAMVGLFLALGLSGVTGIAGGVRLAIWIAVAALFVGAVRSEIRGRRARIK
jgi:hypothetical protein